MNNVSVNAYAHSVTYLADNILFSLKNIIRDSGPDSANFVSDWVSNKRANPLLSAASREATLAIDHARRGRNGEALKAWRALFGPKFPLS